MKKLVNILGIVSVALGVLSIASFVLLPLMSTWFKLVPNFGDQVPMVDMTLNTLKSFFNVKALGFHLESYQLWDWIHFALLLFLLLIVILAIVWAIFLIRRRKYVSLIFVALLLLGTVISCLTIAIECCSRFVLIDAELGMFTFELTTSKALADDWMFIQLISDSLKETSKLLTPINKAAAIIDVTGLVFALLSIGTAIATTCLSILNLKSGKHRRANEFISAQESNGNKATLVRRILVHKSGEVMKVYDKNYSDVTEKKIDKKTEKEHYQELINPKFKKKNSKK